MGQRRGDAWSRQHLRRPVSAVRTLVVVAVVASGVLTSTAAAGSAAVPSVAVTPLTDLVGGQTVSVTGSGWVPGHRVVLCQSGYEKADLSNADEFPDWCAGVPGVVVTVDTAGTFSRAVLMTRTVVSGAGMLDCADPTNGCYEGATDLTVAESASTAVDIFFRPMCSPLTANAHTSFSLSNGDEIGSVATFVADPRYVLFGASKLTCGGTFATWSAPAPTARFTGSAVVIPGSGSVLEGNIATTPLNVPVTLSQAVTHTVTAQWRTVFVPGASGNQADPATDYTPASGMVTFAPGVTSAVAMIRVNGDKAVEPDEYIVVLFGNPTEATIGGFYGLGRGVITNDDGLPAIVPGSGSVLEGSSGLIPLNVPVSLSRPSTQTVTAHWRTVFVRGAPGHQAGPELDYVVTSGLVTFAPGVTTAVATVPVGGDTAVEPDEYVIVQFGDATNATIGGDYGLGEGVITNDDGT